MTATGKSKRYRFWQTPEFKAAICFGLALASLTYLGYQLYDPRYAGPSDDDVAKPYVAVHASTVGAPHEKRDPDPGATDRCPIRHALVRLKHVGALGHQRRRCMTTMTIAAAIAPDNTTSAAVIVVLM